ncbi:unnamed protein product, partial [Pylaiella littoralis]
CQYVFQAVPGPSRKKERWDFHLLSPVRVPPNLLVYDAACKTVRAFEERCPGLLD